MEATIKLSSSPPSNVEGNHSISLNASELRAALDECLTNVESFGSFALFEHVSNPPNPGLYMKKHGTIGLPLSDGDANVIVTASHAAPFGKGSETIVDSSVRKTWELSPPDFEVRNPIWESFVKSIAAKVSIGLGVDSTGKGVSAELYKLLLYDEGAMFKPHQDSEKAARMFATLVIALPSKHEGGEVRVTHAGKTEILETSKFSEFDSSYLAWFADITHEVRPVLSGRRLVLTYNLIHTTLGSKELTANSNKALSKLRPLLSGWRDGIEKDPMLPTTLAFLFDHQYTDASLCYDSLKGHDQQVAANLRKACEDNGFCFYLGNLKRTVEGGCDEDDYGYDNYHPIVEEVDRQTSLKRVVQLDGTEIAKDLDFDEALFMQNDPFEDEEPDDEDYSGFTGNEGVLATHFYNRTVALVMPKNHRMEFFLGPSSKEDDGYASWQHQEINERPKVIEWIDRLSLELAANSDDEAIREDLAQICKVVIRRIKKFKLSPPPTYSWKKPTAPFSGEVIARVITTTVELDNKALFLEAFAAYSGKPNASTFQAVGIALSRYRLESLLPTLTTYMTAIDNISDRLIVINELRIGLEREAKADKEIDATYQDWLKIQTDLALVSDEVTIASDKDGAALAILSRRMPPQEIFNKILPAVKRNVTYPIMAVAFLTGLFNTDLPGEIPSNVGLTIFHDVISDVADSFNLSSIKASLAESNKRIALPSYQRASPPAPSPVTDLQNGQNVAALLCLCQRLEFRTELDSIVKALITDASRAGSDIFHGFYLPFLKNLETLLREKNVSLANSPFPELFQRILGTYVDSYVCAEPTPPQDLKRPTVYCRCQDCLQLNRFLASPTERVGRFAVNQKRRQHLQSMVGSTGCTHETERRGSPQTLIVTKTRAQHLEAHKAWAQRRDTAKKYLEVLGTEEMRELLAEMYGPIMSLAPTQLMRTSQAAGQAAALTASESASNRVLSPITRRKIPISMIVIDD